MLYRLATFLLQNQTFVEATYLQGMSNNTYDGIMGLARPVSTSAYQLAIFVNMWLNNLIPAPIFSFYLNP